VDHQAGLDLRQRKEISWNVDSVIYWLSSLDAVTTDLWCQLIQTPTPRIATDLHLGTFLVNEDDPASRRQVGLQHVPHILLGRLVDLDRLEVLVFFPRAHRAEQTTATLRAADFALWIDRIFLPAVREVLPASQSQAFPSSAQHAHDLATARGQQTTVRDGPALPRTQALTVGLAHGSFGRIWQAVLRRTGLPGHGVFRDPWLMLTGRGVKEVFRGARWTEMMRGFRQTMARHVDLAQVSRSYVDVARDRTPVLSGTRHEAPALPAEVLFWNDAYLRHAVSSLRAADARFQHRAQFFPHYFLRGIGAASFEPAKTSTLWRDGLRYAQFYPSVKNAFAAGEACIGSNPGLVDAAVDPAVLAMFQSIGRATAVDPKRLDRAYHFIKESVDHISQDCRHTSYGHRMEFRVESGLLEELDELMTAYEQDPPEPQRDDLAFTSLALPSELFFRYLRWNINKLLYGFEYVFARSHPSFISWDRTRPMMMFLRAVRCFLGRGAAGEHAAFYQASYGESSQSQRRRSGQTHVHGRPREGLGMGRLMTQYGHAWFMAKLTDELLFAEQHEQQLGFRHTYSAGQYRQHGRAVRQAQSLQVRVDGIDRLLARYGHIRRCWVMLRHFLLQSNAMAFRLDFYRHLTTQVGGNQARAGRVNPIQAGHREADSAMSTGRYPMSVDALRDALDPAAGYQVKIVSHPTARISSYEDWFHRMFVRPQEATGDRGVLAYQVLFQRSYRMVQERMGKGSAIAFSRLFSDYLRRLHWILPYPGRRRFLEVEGKQLRMWSNWSRDIRGGVRSSIPLRRLLAPGVGQWQKGQTNRSMRGLPPMDMSLVDLSEEQMMAHVRELAEDNNENDDHDENDAHDENDDHDNDNKQCRYDTRSKRRRESSEADGAGKTKRRRREGPQSEGPQEARRHTRSQKK
jgi:hypothetical protein